MTSCGSNREPNNVTQFKDPLEFDPLTCTIVNQEYSELMGASYNGHYVGNLVIKVEDPAHPLTACFEGEPFRIYDQAYVPGPPYSRRNLRVLLSLDLTQTPDPTADPKMAWLKKAVERLEAFTGRERDYPISWVKTHGQGRVFYCSLGVWKPPYFDPLFLQYVLAGTQFAIGDPPADTTPSREQSRQYSPAIANSRPSMPCLPATQRSEGVTSLGPGFNARFQLHD